MNGILGRLLSNPHTTGSGGAFVAIKAAQHIALMWTPPQHHDKIRGTAEALESLAVGYGLIMAGDAGRAKKDLEDAKRDVAASIQSGNTDILTKKDLPVTPEPPKTGV